MTRSAQAEGRERRLAAIFLDFPRLPFRRGDDRRSDPDGDRRPLAQATLVVIPPQGPDGECRFDI